MKNILNSKWKLSGYAVLSSIGVIIGGLIVNLNIYVVWGALTSLVILVLVNVLIVLFTKNRRGLDHQAGD